MKRLARKRYNLRRLKETVSILMESALYFDLTLRERVNLIRKVLSPSKENLK